MSLLRFDPFRDLERWSDEAWGQAGRARPVPGTLAFDAYRREHDLVLHFDLPGVDPDSIEVTVERNSLTVAAERRNLRREGDQPIVSERPTGRFVRQLLLGEGLSTDRVHADYDAGVLTVTVPVADEVRPRKVSVNVGSSGGAIDAVSSRSDEPSGDQGAGGGNGKNAAA